MTIEAMKQALEALENAISDDKPYILKSKEAITALRQAIEFAEMVQKGTKAWADTPDDWVDDLRGGAEKQEPSLWFAIGKDGRVKYTTDSGRAIKWKQSDSYRLVRDYYTEPATCQENRQVARTEWVWLTDQDYEEIMKEKTYWYEVAKAVELKAKERNGG